MTLGLSVVKLTNYGYKKIHRNATKTTRYEITIYYKIANKAQYSEMVNYYESQKDVEILAPSRHSDGLGSIQISVDPSSDFFMHLRDLLKSLHVF